MLQLSPADADALESLEEIYYSQSDFEGLEEVLRARADSTNDRDTKLAALARLGQLYDDVLSDNLRAADCYRKILAERPDDAETLASLRQTLTAAESYAELAHSHGMPLRPGMSHAKEIQAFELGQKLYFHRAGAWDFSCASCHGEDDKRIRMSELPVLYKPAVARPLIATWPAYRVSNSQFKTMQWRMNDCYRQMRMPEPAFGSEAAVALVHFLTVTAQGEPYRGPSIKR